MNNTLPSQTKELAHQEKEKTYTRFSLSERIEHIVLLASFTTLAITGLPQKFIDSPISLAMLRLFGGIESTRLIHHTAAIVLLAVSIYHFIAVLYRIYVKRRQMSMLPLPSDFTHLYQDILYYIGLRARKAYYGRFNYGEKVEYLAVVWGTIVMAITGFMMWNPIATTRLLPGEAIPAAKVAHGGEAILAVLSILLWHFYNVHIRRFNKSMFTGKLTEEEMKEEHPAELRQIEEGTLPKTPPIKEQRRREMIFFPVATVLTMVLGIGLFRFVTFEQTAILTVPNPISQEQVFVPITPTPTVTPVPTPTRVPGSGPQLNTWEDGVGQLLAERCGTCHVNAQFGGLSLATYQGAITGGKSGPAVVPHDPDNSMLVQVQSAGNHPGQLTSEELNAIIAWIHAGALEK